MSLATSDFRKGLKLLIEGQPFEIIDFQHVKPGKGGAFVRTKLRGLKSDNVLDKTFRSGDRFEGWDFSEKPLQCLYLEGESAMFMDMETYEQFSIPFSVLGNKRFYLKEGVEVRALFLGTDPLTIEIPTFVELKVAEAEPGVRGDTAQGGTKPATLEGGLVVQVPLFIEQGEVLRVDTSTGMYIERAK
jgi:elongation factor P